MTTPISASEPSGEFFNKVMGLEVLDTHTHLIGGKLAARDFWEIGEYFWLKEELIAAGYPADAEILPEDRRREDIVTAGEDLAGLVAESAAKGAPGVMSTLPGLEGPVAESLQKSTGGLAAEGNSTDQALGHCMHRVCEAAARAGIFFQLFLGIERGHYGVTERFG